MIDTYTIWSNLIKSLKTGLPDYKFIKANQSANMPEYPFVTINILNPYVRDRDSLRGTVVRESVTDNDAKIRISKTETPKMVFSINCYSNKQSEVSQILKETIEWLTFGGLQDLGRYGIVILNNSEIMDRTTFLETDYQYCYGFDLTIRVNDIVSMDADAISGVEITDEVSNENIEA